MTSLFPIANHAEAWLEDAACRGVDPGPFFAVDEAKQQQALELCTSCPVRRECLEYALTSGERHGIWGGATEQDRREMVRQRRQRHRAA